MPVQADMLVPYDFNGKITALKVGNFWGRKQPVLPDPRHAQNAVSVKATLNANSAMYTQHNASHTQICTFVWIRIL